MRSSRLRKTIAKRVFRVAHPGGGPATEAVVSFSTPMRVAGSRDYACFYRIVGLSRDCLRRAMGVDGVQALHLAMANAATLLYTCEEFKSGRLTFLDGSNLALPALASALADTVPPPYDTFLV